MQEHHVKPQAADGSDDKWNLTLLCAGCHHNLHRLSEIILRGQSSRAEDIARQAYPSNGKAVRNIMELSAICAREMQAIREGEGSLPEMMMVGIELPREEVVKLKLQAYEWNNSKAGLRPYLRYVLSLLSQGRLKPTSSRRQPEPDEDDDSGAHSPRVVDFQ